jgi:hypothetical protein
VLAVLLGWGVGLTGCANGRNTVTGRIKPEHFEFTPIVKKSGPRGEPEGWWAVCIHALVTQGDSDAKSVCKFEVGMPQRNEEQGDISLETAQDAAAEMANRAAYRVLSEAHPMTMHVILCGDFKKLYRPMLREKIYGAEVGACTTKGVKVVHFNVPYHCD